MVEIGFGNRDRGGFLRHLRLGLRDLRLSSGDGGLRGVSGGFVSIELLPRDDALICQRQRALILLRGLYRRGLRLHQIGFRSGSIGAGIC